MVANGQGEEAEICMRACCFSCFFSEKLPLISGELCCDLALCLFSLVPRRPPSSTQAIYTQAPYISSGDHFNSLCQSPGALGALCPVASAEPAWLSALPTVVPPCSLLVSLAPGLLCLPGVGVRVLSSGAADTYFAGWSLALCPCCSFSPSFPLDHALISRLHVLWKLPLVCAGALDLSS